ncbi:MAG: hypothetical protein H5U32_02410 [Pseudomonas balearica]|uniref:hypothetical protein n=1 Tax=Stutzerimonas balearica TaxID=74829 RepID=UPI00199DF452|nr:hypothetical protein [Stutzerimonas balearica]MBC7198080.1 hypothetical protein [Stutzerimonas balearica]
MRIEFTEDFLEIADLRERLTELAEAEFAGEVDDAGTMELENLRDVLDQIGTCAGTTLISDEAFQDYIRDTCYDVGDIGRGSWLDSFVDWAKAADSAKIDYRAISIQDESGDTFAIYWVRS